MIFSMIHTVKCVKQRKQYNKTSESFIAGKAKKISVESQI